jgi:hypothetical protein
MQQKIAIMGLFKLCSDPLMVTLRDTFNAVPIKIPEERYKPLAVIAQHKGRERFLSASMTQLLANKEPFQEQSMISTMASVTAKKTRTIDFGLGFQILSGFLEGMGIDGGSIKGSFKDVQTVSFSFKKVERHWLDLGVLGSFLTGKSLDPSHPANSSFLNGEATCLVIDSTINSNNFSMNVEDTNNTDFSMNIPSIQASIGKLNTNLSVESTSDRNISFNGNQMLAFAFSAIGLTINEGKIHFNIDDYIRQTAGGNEKNIQTAAARPLLYQDYGMIDFDED